MVGDVPPQSKTCPWEAASLLIIFTLLNTGETYAKIGGGINVNIIIKG